MTGKTLAQRLSEGKLPPAEALQYAMVLADLLRKTHDEGRAHGAVCPANVTLAGPAVELVGTATFSEVMPYAAPEVLQGKPADARSDLFSFAATLYEMLTGRRAFAGTDRKAPASSGSPAVDRLVSGCVALDPGARPQRMQKVMLDLKLLLVTAQRAAGLAGAAGVRAPEGVSASILRGEIQQVEARLAARVSAHEKALAEVQRMASEAELREPGEGSFKTELLQLEARIAARLQIQERALAEARAAGKLAEPSGAGFQAELQQLEARLAAKFQGYEKILLEMQRLASEPRGSGEADPMLRFEMQQLDARVAARLQANERAMTEMQRIAMEALNRDPGGDSSNRAELLQLEARMAARLQAHEKAAEMRPAGGDGSAFRKELEQMEARFATRLAAQEKNLAETQRSAADALQGLRAQLAEVSGRLAAAQQSGAPAADLDAVAERVLARLQSGIDNVSQRLARLETQGVGGDSARVAQVEQGLDGLRRQVSELHDLVAEDLLSFEQTLKAHGSSIESARAAMAQTDDLVERVVEALETLQSAVLDQTGERALAVN
jgi:hypothetical protein